MLFFFFLNNRQKCTLNCRLYFLHFLAIHSASTRKLYEKKLQKLLDQPPPEAEVPAEVTTLPKTDSNQNGNTNSDQYSDKEDGESWPNFEIGWCLWVSLFSCDDLTFVIQRTLLLLNQNQFLWLRSLWGAEGKPQWLSEPAAGDKLRWAVFYPFWLEEVVKF